MKNTFCGIRGPSNIYKVQASLTCKMILPDIQQGSCATFAFKIKRPDYTGSHKSHLIKSIELGIGLN